jgi:hypothetical protein
MKAKLTLTLEPDVIEMVKDYATEKKISLSKIVETYFKELLKKEHATKVNVAMKYGGVLSSETKSYADVKDEFLEDKYGKL